MIHIEWPSHAFNQLEALPQNLSFEIIRRTDTLSVFPNLGAPLEIYSTKYKGYRQLIIAGKYRVIYQFKEIEQTIFILSVQLCRQRLPSTRELKRRLKP